jgi:hypothetical protein
VKTTFDLPSPLLDQAKALQQGVQQMSAAQLITFSYGRDDQ